MSFVGCFWSWQPRERFHEKRQRHKFQPLGSTHPYDGNSEGSLDTEGFPEGLLLGSELGWEDGKLLGNADGSLLGSLEGIPVGVGEGCVDKLGIISEMIRLR